MSNHNKILFVFGVAVLLGLKCWGMPESVYSGIYLDADVSNTTAVNGTSPWGATTATNGLWYVRAYCNTNTINEIYGPSSMSGGPDLKTTIRNLIPGANYTVSVVYWTKSTTENWEIKAGFAPASAATYNFNNGRLTGAAVISGTVYEKEGLLGTAAADGEGKIAVYVLDNKATSVSRRIWYDGVVYQRGNIPDFNPPNGNQPENQLLDAGQTAVFTALAETTQGTSYQWYKLNPGGSDIPVGILNNPTLTIPNVSLANEGTYYCRAWNIAGSADSNAVSLGIKRMAAWWPLENTWQDASGQGHDAVAAGQPVYVDGISGKAVSIDAANGWATAGTWNPSENTGRLTLSLWAKWAGPNGTYQGLINKRNTWSSSGMMWAIRTDSNSAAMKFNNTTSSVNAGSLTSGLWQHICVTYDGAIAKVYIDAKWVSSGAFQFDQKTDAANVLGAIEGSGLYPFNGLLDDIRIYNYDLGFEAIAVLYTDQRPDEKICLHRPSYDVDGDCRVGITDLVEWLDTWLTEQE